MKDKKNVKNKVDPCAGYQQANEPKNEDTATDVYYKTEKRLPDSKVSIPTLDSVEKAKEWVDDVNKK